jgi:hypothetical protein
MDLVLLVKSSIDFFDELRPFDRILFPVRGHAKLLER